MHMEQQRQLMMRERQQKQAAAAAMAASSSSSTTPAASDSTRTPAAVSPGSANTQQQQQQANKRQLTLTVSTFMYRNSLILSVNNWMGLCGLLTTTYYLPYLRPKFVTFPTLSMSWTLIYSLFQTCLIISSQRKVYSNQISDVLFFSAWWKRFLLFFFLSPLSSFDWRTTCIGHNERLHLHYYSINFCLVERLVNQVSPICISARANVSCSWNVQECKPRESSREGAHFGIYGRRKR